MKCYRTIVADPPWPHERTGLTFTDATSGEFEGHGVPYSVMSLDEIRALPVRDLSDNLDHDAHLYLWTTSRFLRDAFDMAGGWGFHYAATLVWCKPSRGFSVGGTFQNNVEFVLFCKRPKVVSRPEVLRVTSYLADAAEATGITRADLDAHMGTTDMAGWWLSRIEHRCACPTDEQWQRIKAFLNCGDEMDELVAGLNAAKGTLRTPGEQKARGRWFEWPRSAHSQKPEAFLDLVESVSPGPYLEMFSRRARLGWDTHGDESLQTVELAS